MLILLQYASKPSSNYRGPSITPSVQGEFEAPKHGFPMGAAFKDLETLVAAASAQGALFGAKPHCHNWVYFGQGL